MRVCVVTESGFVVPGTLEAIIPAAPGTQDECEYAVTLEYIPLHGTADFNPDDPAKTVLKHCTVHPKRVLPFGFATPSQVFGQVGRRTTRGVIKHVNPDDTYEMGLDFALDDEDAGLILPEEDPDESKSTFAGWESKIGRPFPAKDHTAGESPTAAAGRRRSRRVSAISAGPAGFENQARRMSAVSVYDDNDGIQCARLADLQLTLPLSGFVPTAPHRVGSRIRMFRFSKPSMLASGTVIAANFDITYTIRFDDDGEECAGVLHQELMPMPKESVEAELRAHIEAAQRSLLRMPGSSFSATSGLDACGEHGNDFFPPHRPSGPSGHARETTTTSALGLRRATLREFSHGEAAALATLQDTGRANVQAHSPGPPGLNAQQQQVGNMTKAYGIGLGLPPPQPVPRPTPGFPLPQRPQSLSPQRARAAPRDPKHDPSRIALKRFIEETGGGSPWDQYQFALRKKEVERIARQAANTYESDDRDRSGRSVSFGGEHGGDDGDEDNETETNDDTRRGSKASHRSSLSDGPFHHPQGSSPWFTRHSVTALGGAPFAESQFGASQLHGPAVVHHLPGGEKRVAHKPMPPPRRRSTTVGLTSHRSVYLGSSSRHDAPPVQMMRTRGGSVGDDGGSGRSSATPSAPKPPDGNSVTIHTFRDGQGATAQTQSHAHTHGFGHQVPINRPGSSPRNTPAVGGGAVGGGVVVGGLSCAIPDLPDYGGGGGSTGGVHHHLPAISGAQCSVNMGPGGDHMYNSDTFTKSESTTSPRLPHTAREGRTRGTVVKLNTGDLDNGPRGGPPTSRPSLGGIRIGRGETERRGMRHGSPGGGTASSQSPTRSPKEIIGRPSSSAWSPTSHVPYERLSVRDTVVLNVRGHRAVTVVQCLGGGVYRVIPLYGGGPREVHQIRSHHIKSCRVPDPSMLGAPKSMVNRFISLDPGMNGTVSWEVVRDFLLHMGQELEIESVGPRSMRRLYAKLQLYAGRPSMDTATWLEDKAWRMSFPEFEFAVRHALGEDF